MTIPDESRTRPAAPFFLALLLSLNASSANAAVVSRSTLPIAFDDPCTPEFDIVTGLVEATTVTRVADGAVFLTQNLQGELINTAGSRYRVQENSRLQIRHLPVAVQAQVRGINASGSGHFTTTVALFVDPQGRVARFEPSPAQCQA